jgi:hypothetical protein
MWRWVIGGAAALVVVATLGRRHRQDAAVAGLRSQFAPLARMRLVGACPGLDPVLDDAALAQLFDWMLEDFYRRTGTGDFAGLMRWSADHGPLAANDLSDRVTRLAVDRLPPAALEVIDDCNGRSYAALMIELALNDAGHRIAPAPKGQPV